MTPRSALSRLIMAANMILVRPDQALAPHVQYDLGEIEIDLAAHGLHNVRAVATLWSTLSDISHKPLASGGEIARLVHVAEQARASARSPETHLNGGGRKCVKARNSVCETPIAGRSRSR